MLKTAFLFAASSLAIALMAPDLLTAVMKADTPPTARNAPKAPPPPIETPVAVEEPSPVAVAAPAPSDEGAVTRIPANALGQFRAMVQIDGIDVPMQIDTGADYVLVSASVAERLGLTPDPFEPKKTFRTPSGLTVLSPTALSTVAIGSVSLTNVRAYIADPRAGEVNLVGENYLRRLASVEQRDGYMYLRQ